ncbi:MAG: alpha/beta fold hydrolase [Chloroflexi bacterium]|nr:alpha/beta fold hydrolase [Chloroflexota bacterium]
MRTHLRAARSALTGGLLAVVAFGAGASGSAFAPGSDVTNWARAATSAAEGQLAEAAPSPENASPVPPAQRLQVGDYWVYVPGGLTGAAQVLVALHGMGGSGADLRESLEADAQQYGWVVVAPTFSYGNWWDPAQLTIEAREHLPRIARFLDELPEAIGLAIQPRALLYGYSRGGQTANRFALAFPDRVAGVAIVSAGTYTVPAEQGPAAESGEALPFPFGVADLSQVVGVSFDREAFSAVRIWVGVGEEDADPAETPRQWDRYLGGSRLERAERFAGWVRGAGGWAEAHAFPGVGHGETQAERRAALRFLADLG